MQHMVTTPFPSSYLCFTHCSIIFLGLGAFTSPFIATQFAQLPHWSFNFLVCLGIAMSNVIFLISVFKLKPQNGR